ncbi:MAG: extracellular solute-binding protein [Anaerolineales bacterium]|nr:extracellular solute-binding protein [Anaerolineales bacterium]
MGIAWDDALKDFQAAHPDVKVEFERKTFEQMVQTGKMILNSNDVPDVMEINKGNATIGLYAKEGLLTNLDEVAAERGWDAMLSPSIQTTARYNDQGIMGEGSLFGIPNYGEYVMVYYNKDMFDQYGLQVPTTLEEFNAVADKFVAEGVAPLALGAASGWPPSHNWQELMLYKADRDLINNFQFLTGDVDFQNEAFTFGAEQFAEQAKKGYFGDNANGIIYDDANAAFVQGKVPMNLTGSWAFGGFATKIKDFDWGIFPHARQVARNRFRRQQLDCSGQCQEQGSGVRFH